MVDEYKVNSQGNIDGIPDAVPSIVPSGEYLCQLAKAIMQRTSRFDPTKHYYEWPMILQDIKGNKFDFLFNFSPKNEIFSEILKLVGGKEVENQIVKPPQNSVIGKYFMADVLRRPQKNDPNKFANEIIKVWAYEQKEATAQKISDEIEENKAKFPVDESEENPPF